MPLYNNYFYPVVQKTQQPQQENLRNIIQKICAENIQKGSPVYVKNELAYNADSGNIISSYVVGIALDNAVSGDILNILTSKGTNINLFKDLISGKRYFLGLSGSIADIPYRNVVQIGIAISQEELIYDPIFIVGR